MKPITILYGTETGNAEDCAEDLGRSLKTDGFICSVLDMEDYDASELFSEQLLVIVTSTYGNGEPPCNAEDLLRYLTKQRPSLNGMRFAVCGLGDTSYPLFSQCGKDFDRILRKLGGERVIARVDCDHDFEESFELFCSNLRKYVGVHGNKFARIPNVDDQKSQQPVEEVSTVSGSRRWGLFSR
ncbi:MAG: hypothetical protein CMH56_01540 [Myxococcales bacterium]|nr:hypothetical protein [Myxococcales bacterium]|tara:strand:+ start:1531 stop:2082 length:552 start_codon:yes stop_codon:yes gene_type:complete